jgi:hypothetical protein
VIEEVIVEVIAEVTVEVVVAEMTVVGFFHHFFFQDLIYVEHKT